MNVQTGSLDGRRIQRASHVSLSASPTKSAAACIKHSQFENICCSRGSTEGYAAQLASLSKSKNSQDEEHEGDRLMTNHQMIAAVRSPLAG